MLRNLNGECRRILNLADGEPRTPRIEEGEEVVIELAESDGCLSYALRRYGPLGSTCEDVF